MGSIERREKGDILGATLLPIDTKIDQLGSIVDVDLWFVEKQSNDEVLHSKKHLLNPQMKFLLLLLTLMPMNLILLLMKISLSRLLQMKDGY